MLEKTIVPQKEVRLPVDSHLPTLNQIITRFASRFSSAAPLVRELVVPCAEEAEKIIMEVKELTYAGQTTNIRQNAQRIQRGNMLVYRYYCPVCRKQQIKRDFKYCPICGSKIQWSPNTKRR